MKKLLPLILMLAGAALLFTGCPKDAPEEPVSQPADTPETPDTPAERKWVADSGEITDNGDGTCSFTVNSAYNGTGVVLFINEDKSAVAAGKTVKIVFDYEEAEGWTDAKLFPKFASKFGAAGTVYYNLGDASYYDTTEASGTIEKEFTLTADATVFSIQMNTYEWGGDGDGTSKVNVTLKSVEVK